jgi:hypothetical protein
MRKWFWLMVALLTACGAYEEQEDEIIPIGQTEQAIYLPAGYGTEDDMSACDNNWSGGFCDAPDFRSIGLAVMTNTCDNEFDGYLRLAAERWRKFVVGVGWKALWKENQGPIIGGDQVNFSIGCDGATGGPELGVTQVVTTPDLVPIFGSYECHDAQFGDFCQFQGGRIKIFHKKIRALAAWAGASAAKRENFVVNVAQHEQYHATGLGHRVGVPDGSELMSVAAGTNPNVNFWTIKLSPNSAQRDMLACYNPRSGTSPDDNPACPL